MVYVRLKTAGLVALPLRASYGPNCLVLSSLESTWALQWQTESCNTCAISLQPVTDLTWFKLESTIVAIVSKCSECRGYILQLIHVSKDIFSRMCIRTPGIFFEGGSASGGQTCQVSCQVLQAHDRQRRHGEEVPSLPRTPKRSNYQYGRLFVDIWGRKVYTTWLLGLFGTRELSFLSRSSSFKSLNWTHGLLGLRMMVGLVWSEGVKGPGLAVSGFVLRARVCEALLMTLRTITHEPPSIQT